MRLYASLLCKGKALATWVKSGRKVGEESTKPPGFTVPHCFYIYNISSDDSAAIQTAKAEIYLFTTGTPYKINSQILVLASTGQWFFPLNLTARSHSASVRANFPAWVCSPLCSCVRVCVSVPVRVCVPLWWWWVGGKVIATGLLPAGWPTTATEKSTVLKNTATLSCILKVFNCAVVVCDFWSVLDFEVVECLDDVEYLL